jgi:hypothetical protein
VKIRSEIIGYLLRRNADNAKATAKLVKIAKSETNEELRGKAIRYLSAVKGDDGATNLIEIYNGLQDAKMKHAAIRSLGANKSRKAIDKLIQIAKNDPDPTIRQAAIRTLYGVDERLYLDFIEKSRPKVSSNGSEFEFEFPIEIESLKRKSLKDKEFKLDNKTKEIRKRTQKMMQENQENINELLENLQIENLDKLQLELPKIELMLRELEKEIELGRTIEQRSLIEQQLRHQLIQVGNQIKSLRLQFGESHPKIDATRQMLNTLEGHYQKFRTAQPKPAPVKVISIAQKAPTKIKPVKVVD